MDGELASVRGVVDLSPNEALDEAEDFLTRQGYSVTYRTTNTLTVQRQVSDNAPGQESIFKLIVMALPQSGGGVRIKVSGNDREAVRDHQAAWLEWSETLPQRETPRPTTVADNDVPPRRYCSNCGAELADDVRFCPNCGNPVHETAFVSTPEADRRVPPIPPAAERNAGERLRYGTLDADSRNYQQPRDPGVWTGVKLGCGMFIVLPIIIFVVIIVLIIFVGVIGGSGG